MELNKLTKAELINKVEELENQLNMIKGESNPEIISDSDHIQKLIHNREFDLLMKVFPGALSLFDGNGKLIDLSERSEQIWGFRKEEVIGRQAFDFIHKDDLAETEKIWKRAMQESFAEDYEARLLTRSGNYIHCSFNGTFLKDDNGKFIGALMIVTDKSESRRIMEELKLSEEWHKAIYNNASVYVTVNDLNLHYIHANKKFINELKYSMQELKKMTSFDITFNDDKEESDKLLNQLLNGEIENYRTEKRFIKKDGDIIWVDMSVDTLKNSSGQIEAIICVSSDISERKATERKLLDSGEMLRTVLDTIPARVFWKDINSIYLGCNKICSEDAGLKDPVEIIGKTEYDLNLPEDAEKYLAHDKVVLNSGAIDTNYELRHRKIDGSMQWLKISKTPLKDGTGNVIGILGTYDDISSLKLTEERTIESEEKFRTLFNEAVDGIALADAYSGILTDCNKAFQALLGYDKEELIGMHQSRLHPNTPQNDELMDTFITHRDSELLIPIESEIIKKNSEIRRVEVKASPIMIQGVKYLMGIFRDITDKKKAEIELKESEEKYRLLFEDNPHPMWVYDMGTLKFLAVNKKATQKYGYSLNEFLSMDITQIRPKEDIPRLMDKVDVHNIGIKDEGNWQHITKDGNVIDVRIISNVINFEGKKAELILALDITESLKILRELAEREAKLKGIFNSAPIGIGIILNDFINEVNLKISEITGFSADEFINSKGEFLYESSNEYKRVSLSIESQILESGKAMVETLWVRKDGRKINVQMSATFIGDKDPLNGVIITVLDITDKLKAEQSLHAILEGTSSSTGGEFFRKLVSSIANVTATKCVLIAGYNPESDIARTIAININGAIVPNFDCKFASSMQSINTNDMILKFRESLSDSFSNDIPNGYIPPGAQISAVLTDSTDAPIGILALIDDKPIVDDEGLQKLLKIFSARASSELIRMSAEEKLRESEKLLKHTQEMAMLGSWELDLVSNHRYWSDQTYRIYGYEPGEVDPDYIQEVDYIHPEDYHLIFEANQRSMLDGSKIELEHRIIKKDGSVRFVLSKAGQTFSQEGRPIKITGSILDITERKLAELALKDSEERYKSLFKEMMNAFAYHQLITDENNNPVDYIFLEVNPAWEELTGLKAKDVIGKRVREVIPRIEDHWIKNFGEVAISGKPIHIEDYVEVFDRYYEVISYSNKPGFFAVVFSEITARKKAEIEIQKMNEVLEKKVSDRTEQLNNILNELRLENDKHTDTRKKLEKALSELRKSLDKEKEVNMMKTRFISMISHEYRTPLTVILSSTYLIERYIGINDKANSHLKKIQSSVNLMTNLLEDVITVGKSEEDMLSYIPATIDLPLEINRLLDEVRIIDNNNHGIIFVNELIQDKVLSDAKHLRHIILNLLTNACKYSLPGKTIRISTKEEGDKITISVLDEGIGIPEPDIKHIFEPFFRNKDYIGQIPGSGLGLTIVKRSSDAIGGIITFSSKVNEGTEFKLSFPIKRKNSTH